MRAGLETADELPIVQIPEIPLWSENYCFDGFDPVAGIGFWLHIGRSSQHPRLWREQVCFMLPNEECLVCKSYGQTPVVDGVGANGLSFTCIEPFEHWNLKHFGVVRRITRAELSRGPLIDDHDELLEVDLTFASHTPVWNIGAKANEQIWCTAHYEQSGVAMGTLRIGGRTYDLRASAYRDHSRGPRDLTPMGQHAWIHGSFSDGRAFGMFEMRVRGTADRNLSEGFVYADGRMYDAKVVSVPLLEFEDVVDQPYRLILAGEFGRYEIAGEPQLTLPQSFGPPNEIFVGVARGKASHETFQQSTRFTLDGVTGFGHTERTWRLD
jgi:hypothetical protein